MVTQGAAVTAKNLPDESHPQIEVGNVVFGLRNDVH